MLPIVNYNDSVIKVLLEMPRQHLSTVAEGMVEYVKAALCGFAFDAAVRHLHTPLAGTRPAAFIETRAYNGPEMDSTVRFVVDISDLPFNLSADSNDEQAAVASSIMVTLHDTLKMLLTANEPFVTKAGGVLPQFKGVVVYQPRGGLLHPLSD